MLKQKPHRKIFIIGGIAGVIMFGFCFAMVPLYNLICKKTGISTTINTELTSKALSESISHSPDKTRNITVQFVASNHMGMPWDFYPRTKFVKVHPGDKTKVYFYIKNTTNKNMTVQAIPGMTPTDAIAHFHKIECFCFNQQSLKGGESKEMALVFQLDKNLPKEIHVITLAYTLFDVTPQEIKKG